MNWIEFELDTGEFAQHWLEHQFLPHHVYLKYTLAHPLNTQTGDGQHNH